MDRLPTSALVGSSAVPIAGLSASQLLLPARAGVGPEFALHALVGPGVYAASLLRSAQDELLVAAVRSYGGSQARETIAASHGFDSDLPQTASECERPGTPTLSVFVEGSEDPKTFGAPTSLTSGCGAGLFI